MQENVADSKLSFDGMHLEFMRTPPDSQVGPQSAMQVLLAQLALNRVRYRTVHVSPENIHEVFLVIHPEDMEHFKDICRTVEPVKLLRSVGGGREFQIILKDAGEEKRKYLSVRVLPEECFKIPAPRTSLRSSSRSYHAIVSAQSALNAVFRAIRSWLRPNGLFCVILGPDGVGKSTTIERLQCALQALLGPCSKQRWRPGFIRKVTPDSSNRMPHAKSVRGGYASSLSLLALALDFNLGYAVSAYPAMARSETILFDRYYHDLLIDPKRYRYAGPMWLARLIARLIPPRKALFIILDANEEVILSRKQELPVDELRRQRNAYRRFAALAQNSIVINTEKPVDEIVAEIIDKIMKLLASRNPPNSSDHSPAQANSTRFYHRHHEKRRPPRKASLSRRTSP